MCIAYVVHVFLLIAADSIVLVLQTKAAKSSSFLEIEDSRNISFLLGTSEGVSLFSTAAVDSFATIPFHFNVMAVDYHLARNLVYFFSDGHLYRSNLVPTSDPVSAIPTVVRTMSSCRGFAVDWVHDVIYWVDCNLHSLRMMDLDGKNVTTIIGDLGHRKTVKRVEVDPEVGAVFWIADGTLAGCGLVGENFHTNLNLPQVYVSTFTLDIPTRRLFYVGATTLMTSHLYYTQYSWGGTEGYITQWTTQNLEEVYGLVVLRDVLYWVNNERSREVVYCQSLNNDSLPETINTINRYVWHMRVVDPDLQRPFSGDPCRNSSCSHFCVHQNGVARCLCPDGQALFTNTTCFGGDDREVNFLLGTPAGVRMFSSATVDFMAVIANSTSWVLTVDYHLERNLVYFYSDASLYKNTLAPKTDPVSAPPTLVKKMSTCEGFDVDWVHDVIYWMDCSTNSLMLMDLEGNNVATILNRPGGPMRVERMEVDPHVGRVIWLADGVLEWCDLTGDNFRTNLSMPTIYVRVFTLDIPNRRLFYVHRSTLYEMPYNSSGVAGPTRQVRSPHLKDLLGLAVLGDYFYCVKHTFPLELIYRLLTIIDGLPEPIRKIEEYVPDMKVVHQDIQMPSSGDPCHHSNCSHFCVHQSGVARCLCPDGMTLVGNSTCSAENGDVMSVVGVPGLGMLMILIVVVIMGTIYFLVIRHGRSSKDGVFHGLRLTVMTAIRRPWPGAPRSTTSS